MHHLQSRDVNASELGLVVNKEGGTEGGGVGGVVGRGGVRVRGVESGLVTVCWSLTVVLDCCTVGSGPVKKSCALSKSKY